MKEKTVYVLFSSLMVTITILTVVPGTIAVIGLVGVASIGLKEGFDVVIFLGLGIFSLLLVAEFLDWILSQDRYNKSFDSFWFNAAILSTKFIWFGFATLVLWAGLTIDFNSSLPSSQHSSNTPLFLVIFALVVYLVNLPRAIFHSVLLFPKVRASMRELGQEHKSKLG